MDVAETLQADTPPPMRWTTKRYMALVESGVIEEGRGVELIDGQIVTEMPQGDLHLFAFKAIQRALARMGAFDAGLVVSPTIIMHEGNALDPEFAFLAPEGDGDRLPRAKDVRLVIEVSDTSRGYDLGQKKTSYAESGIPLYWVVDVVKRGVWDFSHPEGGTYREGRFVPEGDGIEIPFFGGTLDTATIFASH